MDRERRAATLRAIGGVLARIDSLATVAPQVLEAICLTEGWPLGLFWELDRGIDVLRCKAVWHDAGVAEETLASARKSLPPGTGLPGRARQSGEPVVEEQGCALPIRDDQAIVGVMEFRAPRMTSRQTEVQDLLCQVGRQIAEALARRRAESVAERLAAELELILDHVPAVVFMFDREQRLTRVEGRRLLESLGMRATELLGRKNDELWPDTRVPENTRRALAGEEFSDLVEIPPGPHFYDTRYIPQRDALGRVTDVIGVATDVTERIIAERRMIEADRLAALGTLASGVAHEINNPLTYAILNLSTIAREVERLPAEIATRLDKLVRETRAGVERVAGVVQDLATLTRSDPEMGAALDVVQLLEAIAATAGGQVRRQARFLTDYGPIPKVAASPGNLSQVFLNLLRWAADHAGRGRADDQEVRVRTVTDAHGRAVVTIGASGPGLSPEHARRVFEPYFGDAGLGLSICKAIVTRLGGEIAIETSLGRGTTFVVTLPAVPPDGPATPEPPARPHLVVVEDEPVLGRAIAEALSADFEVEVFTDGRAALERLAADGPGAAPVDLILCDLIMPVVNGIQVHDALAERTPDLARRLLFMSGGNVNPEVEAFAEKMRGRILEKPFDLQRLQAFIRARRGAR